MLFIPFIFGACLGSFIVSCSQRLVVQHSLITPYRSHCDNCSLILPWWQLIPIISFVFLQGRCSFCNHKITAYMPMIEFISGTAFVILINYNFLHDLIISLFIISLLFLSSTDYFANVIYSFALLGILPIAFLSIPQNYFHNFIAACIIATSLLLFSALTKMLGNGDIEYLFFICIIWGWQQTLLIIQISSIIMLLFFLYTHKKKLPFIPALALCTLLSVFWQGC
ncbi:prepilin peptidase [Limosilactobacillus sp. STM2_1]|uniref:Prepilin peptidase n=1 Tax=Limosilactobacillus rudii TaxID=2759755 RepID=A0A7W3YN76_9LACO|nr:prepilin peptidase [Limosilactobacillus rudii]MBB1097848.1 prepilin peptidase [Limosilactobacillus rudii]